MQTMNWVFVAVLVIFGIFMIRGWHRGLLRILYGLVSLLLLIALVSWAVPKVSDYLQNNTKVHTKVEQQCEKKIQKQLEKQMKDSQEEQDAEHRESTGLPGAVAEFLGEETGILLQESGIYQYAGGQAAQWIIRATVFLVVLILAIILLSVIGHALDLVHKIPIIKGINRTLGLFAGIIQAYIVISILFLILTLITHTEAGHYCLTQINANPFLEFLYYNNFLAKILTLG